MAFPKKPIVDQRNTFADKTLHFLCFPCLDLMRHWAGGQSAQPAHTPHPGPFEPMLSRDMSACPDGTDVHQDFLSQECSAIAGSALGT